LGGRKHGEKPFAFFCVRVRVELVLRARNPHHVVVHFAEEEKKNYA
jgi:hypothetical protein